MNVIRKCLEARKQYAQCQADLKKLMTNEVDD